MMSIVSIRQLFDVPLVTVIVCRPRARPETLSPEPKVELAAMLNTPVVELVIEKPPYADEVKLDQLTLPSMLRVLVPEYTAEFEFPLNSNPVPKKV